MNRIWAPWRMTYISGEPEQGCIFCLRELAEQDTARQVLFRGQHAFVMMNRFPYTNGHMMVAPYRHSADLAAFDDVEVVEMHRLVCVARDVLVQVSRPDGFNVGLNIGRAAGAGITDHLHYHIVPRWNGDTNFMPVFADVRVVPQHLEETYRLLRQAFQERISVPS